MFRRPISLLIAVGCSLIAMPSPAAAQTALTRATVESLQNRVQLILQDGNSRAARISDTMTPGDGLTTGQSSLAQLRFNDGSLGRMGEQVIFWFTPGTRNFSLSNGTVLLLIPPGQGSTYIRTPNAAAGIQGSALFVRYIEESDTTLIGALTNSGIRAYSTDGSQVWELEAGQMAVAVGDRLDAIYNFDLDLFHETSALMQGFSPKDEQGNSDEAIALVQQEMQEALDAYEPIDAEGAIDTPTFVLLPPSNGDEMPTNLDMPDFARQPFVVPSSNRTPSDRSTRTNRETLRESGEVSQEQRDRQATPDDPSANDPTLGDRSNQRNQGDRSNQQNQGDRSNQQNQGDRSNQQNQGDRSNQQNQGDRPGRPDRSNPINRDDRDVRGGNPGGTPGLGERPSDRPDRPDRPTNPGPGLGELPDRDFPGQGQGVQDGFPGQGQGVQDGFPGQGQGVQDGFPGGRGGRN